MALQPLALSLLGVETPTRRRHAERAEGDTGEPRPARTSRRATSYYNTFQTTCTPATDEPPSYHVAANQKPAHRRSLDGGREILPKYTCTVAAEAKVLLNIESVSPLHGVAPSEWREVHLVLRGTLLSFYKPKDTRPGKLLRTYTLQHAEVGLASDVQHTTLEPRTKLAHLIPSAARRRAWQKDPDLFEPVKQYCMRLRVETDQIVLAAACEERIFSLIHAVSAGIDISCPVDERSIPRQCTVPRRRRRHRHHRLPDLIDPAVLAEQERILREMYPGFAERAVDQLGPELGTITTITAGTADGGVSHEPPSTPRREEDEIDLSMIREEQEGPSPPLADPNRRPVMLRSITDTSVNTTFSGDMVFATSPDNFDLETGKWRPPHTRTPRQMQSYIKRCMPTLHADSTRASDIMICNGKRVRVNLRMEVLEEWELQPPKYKSHGFAQVTDVERPQSLSQQSVSPSATQENGQMSSSVLGVEGEDQITRAEDGLANLELTKVSSIPATDKGARREAASSKRQETGDPTSDIHGVVFCF